ncbi:MAG: hypothetical protein Kow0092_39020 [Deferrisomatales bacterium]
MELPEVVVRGIDQVRLEARRRGVLALEPPRIAESPVRVELPAGELPSPALQEAPPVRSPGCAYRNPITGAFARATQGAEGLYKTALERLSRGAWGDAAYYLARLRSRYPDHPAADDAAFWLGEINRRAGRLEEAAAFLRLVRGSYAHEAAYRLAWLLDEAGRARDARAVWEQIARTPASPFRAEALYRVGARELTDGRPQAATAAFQAVVDLSGERPEAVPADLRSAAVLGLGLAERRQGRLAEAEARLVQFLLERPDHPAAPAAQLALGWTLLDRGDAPEAAQRFQWVLEAEPPPPIESRALYGRLRARVEMGATEEALTDLAALEATAPEGPWVGWARADLGWAAFRAGRYDEALERYRTAAQAWRGEGGDVPRYMEAECLYLLGRYAEAAPVFLETPPGSPLRPAALHRAGLCRLLNGEAGPAARLLEQVVHRYPNYPDLPRVWAWLGEARLRLGQTAEALEALHRVPRDSSAYPQALYGRAWAAFEDAQWDQAAALFGELAQRYPDDPNREETLLTLARAHFNRREVGAALETLDRLEQATASHEYRRAARYYRGWMLARTGRETVGREILEQLLAEGPRGPYAPQAQLTLGWLDYAAGRYEDALARFEAAAALSPGGAVGTEARRKLADSLYNLGRYEEALDAYRALGPGPAALYGTGMSLYRLGRTEELARLVDRFLERHPADPQAVDLLFALADAREQGGDPAGAAQAYERAARLDRESRRSGEARLEAARALARGGDEPAAQEIFEALALRPGPVGQAALRELAALFEQAGDAAGARGAWDRLAEATEGEQRSRALRSAARWARTELDWAGAQARLEQALAACPPDAPVLRQAVLADLGEVLLLRGAPDDAAAPLRQAAELGVSPEGLRALVTLGRAHEALGDGKQALETYLRIGYLYPLGELPAARAVMRAGVMLEEAGRSAQARSVFRKLADQAPAEVAEAARERLRRPASAPGTQESRP